MNFEKTIIIRGKTYNLIRIQRSGSAIYKSTDTYLRMGSNEKIKLDLDLHKEMENLRFPVAKFLDEGQYEDFTYFVEESLGENHFGQIFKTETEALGQVDDKSFDKFLDISIKFAEAQLKTIIEKKDWDGFSQGIHLDIIGQELPHEKAKIVQRYKVAEKRLDVFPFGILHGDFTPFNIYPKGVIDLEDSFFGPVSYDLGSFLGIQNWFPETSDDEFYRVYKFTPSQITKFGDSIDNIYLREGLPKPSDYRDDFNFTKGIWFTVRMQSLPKLQQYRYQLIKNLV